MRAFGCSLEAQRNPSKISRLHRPSLPSTFETFVILGVPRGSRFCRKLLKVQRDPVPDSNGLSKWSGSQPISAQAGLDFSIAWSIVIGVQASLSQLGIESC